MADLPTGTVTFLFTDIEGSTRLWEQHPEAMRSGVARHDALLRAAIESNRGHVFKTIGDQFCAAFATAPEGVAAALTAQRALCAEPWGELGQAASLPHLRVRMALDTGVAEERDGDYFGPPLNRVARLLETGHGGQTLLSQPTFDLARDQLPESASVRDLDEHRLRDLPRPERIFQLLHTDLPAEFPPLRSLDFLPNNLPQQVTSFVGRETEIADLKRLLDTTHLLTLTGAGGTGKTRLALQVAADLLHSFSDGVWLVELAPLSNPELVPQTVASVLNVREAPGQPIHQTLVEVLKAKRLLLLLDNCEHLLGSCSRLADALLRGCPHVRLLATSREGLNIPGEHPYRLRSLSVPDPGEWSMVNGQWLMADSRTRPHQPSTINHQPSPLLQYEAVQLFVERAATVAPSFTITSQNALAVAQVCYRLDGIPLALELAAARVKALPVEKLNERLDDRFRLLTGGSRTALPRQQTLRALIDWSYDLLAEAERALLRRLSVFAGGWTLEGAEAVCAFGARVEGLGLRVESDEKTSILNPQSSTLPLDEWQVLDLLTALVEKSLVQYEDRGPEARYRLLETVRQYARDRLLESGEAETVRDRHREHFLQLAEHAAPELQGSEQVAWLDRLEGEHDNLRAALSWCRGTEAAARLALALGEFWDARGHRMEGWEALHRVLEQGAEMPADLRARVMRAAGLMAHRVGEYGQARALLEESLALCRRLGAPAELAEVLHHLGALEYQQGHLQTAHAYLEESLDLRRGAGDRLIAITLNTLGNVRGALGDAAGARTCLEECLALFRQLGNKRRIAMALVNLGGLAVNQGDDTAARPLIEESLTRYREVGDEGGVALALGQLAWIAHRQGDPARAAALCEESVALWRKVGERDRLAGALNALGTMARAQGHADAARSHIEEALAMSRELGLPRAIAQSLHSLGYLARDAGDYGWASALFGERLRVSQEQGDSRVIAACLAGLAAVAVAEGRAKRAARLLGAAEALPKAVGTPFWPADRNEYDRTVTAARDALGEEAFAAAWTQGQAMSLEDTIACALGDVADAG